MKAMKKMLAAALAAAIAVTCVVPAYANGEVQSDTQGQEQPSINIEVQADKTSTGLNPVVSTSKDGTAKLDEVKKTNKTSVKVSSTVTVDGVKYTVTTITANAFAKCAKMKDVTIPSSVTKVAKGALKGAKKLTKMTLKGKPVVKKGALKGAAKLKTITLTGKADFEKGAFKGLDTEKMTIKISKNMSAKKFKAYKKELKAAGFKGKIKKA